MDSSMSFNPELSFYSWLCDIAYILDTDRRAVEKDADLWRSYFDKSMKPSAAITARQAELSN